MNHHCPKCKMIDALLKLHQRIEKLEEAEERRAKAEAATRRSADEDASLQASIASGEAERMYKDGGPY